MKLTIQDVARLAGVGVGTVSRVLNNHPSVRPATRLKIEEAMRALDYVPNPHARRVAGGRSYTVSVLLPVVATEFYTRLLDGMEATLAESRYDTALFPILNEERLVRYLSSNTLAFQADGVILATHNLGELYPNGRLPTQHPVALADAQSPNYDSSFLDNEMGGCIAGEFLSGFDGPIHGIFVREPLDRAFSSTVFADRMAGFQRAVEARGRTLGPERLHAVALNQDSARTALHRVLEAERGTPVNVFAAADNLARGVLEECAVLGLKPGLDVRVVGFDNHPWAADIGLTTIEQPVEAMGSAAARLLIRRLEGYSGPPESIRFEPRLIERASARHAIKTTS